MKGRDRICRQLRNVGLAHAAAQNHRGPVRHHDSAADLSQEILAEANRGTAVCILGRILAEIQFVVAAVGANEVLLCLQGRLERPELICRIMIPPQQVASGYCAVNASAVLRMAMDAFDAGYCLVTEIHSHGWSSSFTSSIDVDQLVRQARERIGLKSVLRRRIEGQVRRIDGAGGQADPAVEAVFPKCPDTKVLIRGAAADRPLRVELHRDLQRVTSCFATTNQRAEMIFPTLQMHRCPHCGNAKVAAVHQPEEVTLHVFGPVELSDERAEQLLAEVRRNVRSFTSGRDADQAADAKETSVELILHGHGKPAAKGEAGAKAVGVAPYRVTRGGFQASIPAAVLEEAAAKCPRLAEQLGWDARPKPPGHGDGKDDR